MIGLLLDIIGGVMLYFFGLPSELTKNGNMSVVVSLPPEKKKKAQLFNGLAKVALWLIILGFVFQFIGTVFSIKSLSSS